MKRLISILILTILVGSCLFAQENQSEKKEMNPVLLVVDVQKEYLPMMSQEDMDKAIEMMNWSIWVFRKFDLPVIRVYHTSPEWGPAIDSPGFEFHDSLKVTEDDPKIIKTYGSAFNKTDLDKLLKEKDIKTVFICGLSSVGCVMATYMDAANYDYKAFMIKDALLSHDHQYTNDIEKIYNALDLETIMYMIEISRN